jgi:tetratricopeptide (TPR) repeat protein
VTLDDRTASHRSAALIALRDRHWAEAQRELQALLNLVPNDAIAWNNLGVALERQKKQREAVEAFARASALLPKGTLPGRNLIREMQRYLGFAAAIVLFKAIDLLFRFLPLSSNARTAATLVAVVLLALGALVYYQRQRERLPEETWRAYKSVMLRTRQIRYGGIGFVFIGFLAFALVLVVLIQFGPGTGDGTVVLIIVAGLCWLIVAQLLWRRVIAPFLERRMDP